MHYVSKKFLNNSVYENGSIVSIVESPKDPEKIKYYNEVECTVQIRDCNNVVSLDFRVHNESGLQKRLAKLDVLINELLDVKQELRIQWDYLSKHRPSAEDKDSEN